MKNLLVLISCCAIPMSAAAQNTVHGGVDKKDIRWVGLSIDDPSRLSPPEASVSQAFQAAARGDRSAFYSHWKIDGATKAKTEEFYREWNANSKDYNYIIGAEAVVGGKSGTDQLLAISIIPFSRKGLDPRNEISRIQVDVLCALESSNHITLLTEIPDNSMKQALLQKSLPSLYHPRLPLNLNLARGDLQRFHQFSLEVMKSNGVSPEYLASRRADYQMDDAGVQITDWNTWTNWFATVIPDRPFAFEKAAPYNYDYHDAIAAFHSYAHAGFIGDGKELLHHADDTGLAFLREMHVSETGKGVYDLPTMTHVTVLLTATTLFEGNEYTLVLWRQENSQNPRNGRVALQVMIFVKQNGSFLMTQNLLDSRFGAVREWAGCHGGGLWKYAQFEQVMEKTQFPKSFYGIPE